MSRVNIQNLQDKIEEESRVQKSLALCKSNDVGKIPIRLKDNSQTTYLVKKKDYERKKKKYIPQTRTHIV